MRAGEREYANSANTNTSFFRDIDFMFVEKRELLFSIHFANKYKSIFRTGEMRSGVFVVGARPR